MNDEKISKMWGGRFSSPSSELMEGINASIDFDKRLALIDVKCSRVHASMLAAEGIIPNDDVKQILSGLDAIEKEIEEGKFKFSRKLEDIHMNIENALSDKIGSVAGKVHTARSRNDQVATDFKIWVKEYSLIVISLLEEVMEALLDQADKGCDWLMPGFTHLQVAQPVTWGHHMMAYIEMFSRDCSRFEDAVVRMDECPLGSAALAGTSFPIDRCVTAKELGFSRPSSNSLDAVSDRDFAIEFLSCASLCLVHISRFAEEMVIWNSQQFGFIKFSDQFVTGSSIMPQKKNPDAAEILRSKSGRVFGALVSLLTVMKSLPLAYSKDMQEDKEPVFDTGDTLLVVLKVLCALIQDMSPCKDKLKQAAGSGYSVATDIADFLVRSYDMPFREAHHVVGQMVKLAESRVCDLHDLLLEDFQAIDNRIDNDIFSVISVEGSVASKSSYGGTAPEQVRAQISRWREKLLQGKDILDY